MSNGLKEIIKSGKAPGISGQHTIDPTSVYAKAPKGLAAIENESKFRHGPTRSAKDISRYMGMSTSFIRDTWRKAVLVALLCFCWASYAGDIQPGTSLTDGQLVHASDLNNLVGNATINNSFISGKPIDPSPLGSDKWIIYSPTLNGLYSLTLNAGVLQNSALITAQSEKVTPIAGDYLLMWDSVGMNLAKVSAGNLTLNNTNLISGQPFMQASNLDPQLHIPILNYGTNAQTTFSNALATLFTNVQFLYPKTYVISNLPSNATLGTAILDTNISFNNLVPVVYPVLVCTNQTGSPFNVGDEIPASQFMNASRTNTAFVWGAKTNDVFVSMCYTAGSLDLTVPQRAAQTTEALVSHDRFNIKVYITYYPISP